MPVTNFDHYTTRTANFDGTLVGEAISAVCAGPKGETELGTMRPLWFDHLAFAGEEFEDAARRSRETSIPFLDESVFIVTAPSSGRPRRWRLLQCIDPDGIKISINFPMD